MKVLFLNLLDFNSFNEKNIYTDLLREFIKNKHEVFCISPAERRTKVKTHFEENGHILKLKIGNTQKTNIIEKGISTLMIEKQFISAIKKYFSNIKFDLILYTTPPITFASVIKFVKKRDRAKTYLMLKDIFPQNAVDLGLMSKTGIKGLMYKFFRNKEKKLYMLSDYIGCMSQANVQYVLKHNPQVSQNKLGICPNSVDVQNVILSKNEKISIREKYEIPQDKKVFIYGGNLGKPQDVPFIINCFKEAEKINNAYFIVAGSGTDKHLFEKYIKEEKPENVRLFDLLPKEEYDKIVASCDVGLIFLNHLFTIPNFPSRLLSYLQAAIPVLACTDSNTDISNVIEEGNFGKWCESDKVSNFINAVNYFCENNISNMGLRGKDYLLNHYDVKFSYQAIIDKMN